MPGHSKWANIRRRAKKRGADRNQLAARASGEGFETVRYEGYGPGGAAIMVECVTDNRGRTGSEIRRAFTKYGGNLGADRSVSYLFNWVGLMTYPAGTDQERLMQVALEAGAEDVVTNADSSIEVLADPAEFEAVRAILAGRGFAPATAEVTQRASISTALSGEAAELMVHLLEALEALEAVRNVYSNVEISDEVVARI